MQVLNIKTTYETFPNCKALVSLEDSLGVETLYTFSFTLGEYEEYLEEEFGIYEKGTIELVELSNTITNKDNVIDYLNSIIDELGNFDFMNEYSLELYKDPTQVIIKQGDFGKDRNKWKHSNATLRASIKKDQFVIKEEFGQDVIFLYS